MGPRGEGQLLMQLLLVMVVVILLTHHLDTVPALAGDYRDGANAVPGRFAGRRGTLGS